MSAITLPPRQAVKFAGIAVDLHRGEGRFVPHGDGIGYRAEDAAVCGRGGTHAVPAESCSCGFYAARSLGDLLDLLRPSLAQLAGSALLDVELGGIELAGPMGIRAAEQRVLGAGVIPYCAVCLSVDAPRSERPHLFVKNDPAFRQPQVLPLCDRHADTPDLRELTLADVSGLLRTEVRWGSEEFAERLRDHALMYVARGETRGPLLAERQVRNLRMGQVGFVRLDALRMDSGGRLWVDARCPAIQRRKDGHVAPVLRSVGMWLELIVTPELGARIDGQVSRPVPPRIQAIEMPVDVVQGLRHAPRLAAALGW